VAAKPSLQALLLADDVRYDDDTGKITVTGIFDRIRVQRPDTHFGGPAYLFVALKNIHGQAEIVIRFVDLADYGLLSQYTELVVPQDDRLATAVVALRLTRGLPVRHPGVYALELHCGNEMLGSIRVVATVLNEGEQS
jgi:hypothetical protein